MPRFLIVILAAVLAFTAPVAFAADAFVHGIEDLPLMPGLEPFGNADVAFDSPGGRIVIAYAAPAAGPTAPKQPDITAFYARALPALGWEAVSTQNYKREGERLEIQFGSAKGQLTVRFSLSPQR